MQDHEDHNEIMLLLGKVDGKIDGINEHLRVLNHTTEKNTGEINVLKLDAAEQKGSWRTTGMIAGGLATVVGLLVAYFK